MINSLNDLAVSDGPRTGILQPHVAYQVGEVRLSEVLPALSFALDLAEGQPAGHAVRTCVIGMRMGDVLHLSPDEKSALFYALLLKDLGGSSNASRLARLFKADDLALKRAHRLTDWTRPAESARYAFQQARPGDGMLPRAWHALKIGLTERGSSREMTETRSDRGADIAHYLGLEPATQEAIRALDEHWDGRGMPCYRRGGQIPLLGRIAALAQTVEVFASGFGVGTAFEVARARSGTWFDPALVEVLEAFEGEHGFWSALLATDRLEHVADLEPADRVLFADEARLDQVAEAFARVIDAKSPYTALHSHGVAAMAVEIGRGLGCSERDLVTLRRAGLLHDIGKLGVSSRILDKPGKLTEAEMAEMRKHPQCGLEILVRVRRFAEYAELAAAHHERLDGSGYHLGLFGPQVSPLARVLALANACEALSAERPYRRALPRDEVLAVIQRQVGIGFCPLAFEVLEGMAEWPVG